MITRTPKVIRSMPFKARASLSMLLRTFEAKMLYFMLAAGPGCERREINTTRHGFLSVRERGRYLF